MAAIWPSAVATDADLYVAVNSLQTTLATALGTGDTSVVLASATGFPVAGAVTIGNEVIFYTNISGATLTGCTRGADGTTAATHSVGVPVGAAIIAFHHNGLKNEIEALETWLDSHLGKGTTVTATEFGYLSGVTSAIQTQLAARLPLAGGTMSGNIAMGSNKLTGLAAGTTNGDSLRYEQVIGQFLLLSGGTLSGALTISPTSNQIVLGATRTVTLTAPTPATTSRTWTIPDITADGTFAALQGTQTFTGTKTFSALIATLAGNLVAGSNKITGLAAGTTAGDSVRYEQLNPGKILQVVLGTSTTFKSTTSSTYQTTNLTATITPTSATSKIIVIAFGDLQTGSTTTVVQAALFRDSTNISSNSVGAALLCITAGSQSVPASMGTIDSPASTSAIVYSVKLASSNNASSVTWGASTGQTLIVLEIGQ